jgi:hypothetical protein
MTFFVSPFHVPLSRPCFYSNVDRFPALVLSHCLKKNYYLVDNNENKTAGLASRRFACSSWDPGHLLKVIIQKLYQ